ncbi:MAG TPA: hypothetical protein VEY09_16105 [Pyrinomonadaceae bacterium]|nr:hypothetical protein [Pyrinomonadaceae bacterium]
MSLCKSAKVLGGSCLLLAALAGAACQQAAVTNTNTTTTGANLNINSSNSANMTSTTMTTGGGATIEAKEPDKYSAVVHVSGTTQGQQSATFQQQIEVARNGADRVYSVNTPMGRLAFLDKPDKRYVIIEGRKQYAELTPEMTGFEIGRSLTPGQMVAYTSRQQGVTKVGEESLNGRMTTKYRVAGQTNTNTQAGQVQGESFIYVDNETGLPLRVEGFSQATGNVQGVSGGNVVVEMRDIKTDVDPTRFEIPQGYAKLEPEQVRQFMNQAGQLLQGVINMMNAQQGGGAAPSPAPSR